MQKFMFYVVSPLSLRPPHYLISANLQYPMCASYEQTYPVSVAISGLCLVCIVQLVEIIIIYNVQCSEYAVCSVDSVQNMQFAVCKVFIVNNVYCVQCLMCTLYLKMHSQQASWSNCTCRAKLATSPGCLWKVVDF